jgi:hypothetical protein
MVLYDPRFPQVGKATTKTAFTMTRITGRNAAGEAFPHHLQFPTKAKLKDLMQLDYNMVEFMRLVRGRFGCKESTVGQSHLARTRREGWTRKSSLPTS